MKIFFFNLINRCLLASIILGIFAACSGSGNKNEKLPAEELRELDVMLRDSKDYAKVKIVRLDSLKAQLNKTPDADREKRIELLKSLGNAYRSFCSDSSVIFYYRAYKLGREINPQDSLDDIKISLVNSLAASGLFGQAEKLLSTIDTTRLSPQQKLNYNQSGRQLYSYFKGYLDDENELMPVLTANYDLYDNYLCSNYPKDSNYYKFLIAEKNVKEGRNKEARKQLEEILRQVDKKDNLYGMVAYQCAEACRNSGDDYNYGRYLTLSAQSDVQGAVKETLALPALARWLYEKGDVDRAYKYINASLNDASQSNSRMRTVAIADFVPMIDNSYRQKISASRDELMIYFLLVAVLAVTTACLLVFLFKNLRKSNQIRRKLRAQSKMQENYIGHFLGLCASYADKLDSTRKLVTRKISAGQTDELLKLLKNPRTPDESADNFFKIFDETFLDLYPDFIDNFNTLLREEEQITIPKNSPLTTELRIYAFVRLGVQESQKIAQILRCSVSTIYTYRNRMRSRAINRDTFEADVASLGVDEEQ